MKIIKVKSPDGIEYQLSECADNFICCSECDMPVKPGEFYTICSKCGGVICRNCVENGRFSAHDDGNESDGFYKSEEDYV